MANIKICPGCGKNFDVNLEEYCHRGNRYWHEECLKIKHPNEEYTVTKPEPKQSTAHGKNEKKCCYCNKYFDITKEKFSMASQKRYAHEECYNKYHTEDEDYIDEIYRVLKEHHIKYEWHICNAQREKFITNNGYTNKGIMTALKYFYDVKNGDAAKSYGGIGIVPFIYDEAKAYYETLERTQKRLAKEVKEQMQQERIKIIVRGEQKRRGKQYIDLDTLGE